VKQEKEYYSVYEMARRMNVTPPTIYRWITEGLKTTKQTKGRQVRQVVTDNDVTDFLMENPELQ
jgi:excisionase family DNA binding protein